MCSSVCSQACSLEDRHIQQVKQLLTSSWSPKALLRYDCTLAALMTCSHRASFWEEHQPVCAQHNDTSSNRLSCLVTFMPDKPTLAASIHNRLDHTTQPYGHEVRVSSIVRQLSHMAHVLIAIQGAYVTILVHLLAPHLHAKHAVLQHSDCGVRSSC